MTGSVEESPALREAWMLLFQGDVKPAATQFQTLLAETDGPSPAAGLLLCAAVMGAGDAVAALLADRWERRRDAGLVLWRAAWICASNGSDQGLACLKSALSGFPADGKEQAVLHYAAGHIAMLGGDEGAAIAGFTAARRGFETDPEWFLASGDPTLTNVFVQTGQLLEVDQTDALATGIETPPNLQPVGDQTPCIAVAADGAYLRRVGPGFVKSLGESNPGLSLLVLAVDADPADTAPLAEAGTDLFLGIEHAESGFPGVNRPAVYASWRFLAMRRLLAENKRPFLVLDIDLLVRKPLTLLFDRMKEADFGAWLRLDGGPGGIVRGGATGFAPTENAWWMAALTERYITARFAEEQETLWFVDQAALWRASHEAKKHRPDFRLADFHPAGAFTDFFDLVRDEDVKKR